MFASSRFSVRRIRWVCACLLASALMGLSARSGGAAQRPAAAPAPAYKTIFEKNVAVPVRDGTILRANIYRPDAGATKFPVILTIATYGKDYDMTGGRLPYWEDIHINFPEVCENSTCREIVYETVDPERWVQKGYVLVRVDSRGTGRSPGVVEAFGLQETFDFYDAIEWAATQPWSTGKIGTAGISYYAWKVWQVAALNPPHLAAAVNWEGSSDFYREVAYHGGIRNSGGELIYYHMNSHHHGDHLAGLRAFVAEGSTIITHEMNKRFYRQVVLKTPHTLVPDSLSRNPRPAKFIWVRDKYVLTDGDRSLEIYFVPTGHSENQIMGYLPNEGILFVTDMLNIYVHFGEVHPNDPPAGIVSPYTAEMGQRIKQLNLNVKQVAVSHAKQAVPAEVLWQAMEGTVQVPPPAPLD